MIKVIVFLEKVRAKTIFSKFDPIITEPLELLYLKGLLDELKIKNYLIDPLFKLQEPQGIKPDLIILTAYNTGRDKIIQRAGYYKAKFPNTKIMVGGVSIQLNRDDYKDSNIDYIFHSLSLVNFKDFILNFNNLKAPFPGLDINNGKGLFIEGRDFIVNELDTIKPSRDFFYENKERLRYLDKGGLALIKSSMGCPYNCSYCYCSALNLNNHIRGDFDLVFKEMTSIHSKVFWIVDDVLFSNKKEALQFIEASKKYKFQGEIIAYLRSDFVIKNKDLISDLKDAGLSEVICGFETPDKKELTYYNKKTDVEDYPSVIKILRENKIRLSALFMVNPNYGFKEFIRLNDFIWKNKIDIYTISIMTPLKGTKDYNKYVDKIIDFEPKHYDFLHLVLPSKLPKPIFYTLFYCLHLKLLFSKRVWAFIFKKNKDFKKKIWDFWANKYDRLWVQKLSLKPTRDKISDLIGKEFNKENLKIIDIGCGPGELINQLQDKSNNLEFTGVDFSKEMIKQSQLKNAHAKHYLLDVNDLDNLNKTYDILTCTHSLPYYKDVKEILNKFANKLNPNGTIYLAFASGDSLYDKIVLSFVKLTTGPAKYPSDKTFRKLLPESLEIQSRQVIKKRWYMPTIALYVLKGAKV